MEAAKEERSRQLNILRLRGLNPDGLEAHLRNLAVDRAGIIRYEYALDSRRGKLYTQENRVLDNAVAAIARAMERVRQ
jgi:hypothetical protein